MQRDSVGEETIVKLVTTPQFSFGESNNISFKGCSTLAITLLQDGIYTLGSCQSYVGCGVATELHAKCMTNPLITADGGVDINEHLNHHGERSIDQASVKHIKDMCETVIAMPCFMGTRNWLNKAPPRWCQVFFDAAIKAKFQYFISKQDSVINYQATKTAKDGFMKMIKNYPEIDSLQLENEFGRFWYFCKCKPEKQKECDDKFQ